jgi:molybdate transport system substrate-binding protein
MPRGPLRLLCCLVFAVGAFTSHGSLHAQAPAPLSIAAASDLQTVFPELVKGFERATGVKTRVTFGSSGTFFAQIQNGAPFDLYFSADIDYPRRLATSGHADAATLYRYATGRLVLWTRHDSGIDVKPGLRILTDARVKRVAIANPTLAPYGRAAVAALRSAKVYDAVQPKFVQGDNIAQTAQLADSGNADVALLSHSLALGPALRASGTFAEIPASAHPPIEQAAILVSATRQRAAAERFLAYMKGTAAQATLRTFGFMTPKP